MITAFVLPVSRMSPNPFELDLVLVAKIEHLLPEVGIANFLVAPFPVIILPTPRPAFGHAVDYILRIGIERHGGRVFERPQPDDAGENLHAIVRRQPEPA